MAELGFPSRPLTEENLGGASNSKAALVSLGISVVVKGDAWCFHAFVSSREGRKRARSHPSLMVQQLGACSSQRTGLKCPKR